MLCQNAGEHILRFHRIIANDELEDLGRCPHGCGLTVWSGLQLVDQRLGEFLHEAQFQLTKSNGNNKLEKKEEQGKKAKASEVLLGVQCNMSHVSQDEPRRLNWSRAPLTSTQDKLG